MIVLEKWFGDICCSRDSAYVVFDFLHKFRRLRISLEKFKIFELDSRKFSMNIHYCILTVGIVLR